MKTKVMILTAGLFLLIAFPQHMNAQQHHEMNKNSNHNCILDDLSDEQQTAIDAIKLESFKKTALLNADIDIKEAELDKLLLEDEPSKTKINEKIDEISILKANIQKENMSRRIDIRNELTPEQQNIFDMHKRHQMHPENGHNKNHNNSKHCNDGNMHHNGEGRPNMNHHHN